MHVAELSGDFTLLAEYTKSFLRTFFFLKCSTLRTVTCGWVNIFRSRIWFLSCQGFGGKKHYIYQTTSALRSKEKDFFPQW